MFTGSIRDRKVSGVLKRGSNNKDTFLEETRKKREERAINKAKDNASIIIQSYYRSYSIRIKYNNTITNDFNKKINDIIKIKNIFLLKNVNFLVPIDTLISIIRLYIISIKNYKRIDRYQCNLFNNINNIQTLLYIQSLLLESINSIEQHNILLYCYNLVNNYQQYNTINDIVNNNNGSSSSSSLSLLLVIFQLRDLLKLTILYLEYYYTSNDKTNITNIDISINILRSFINLISSNDNTHKAVLMTISYLLVPSICKSLKNLLANSSMTSNNEYNEKKSVYVNILIDFIVNTLRVNDDSLNLFRSHRLHNNVWGVLSDSLLTMPDISETLILNRLIAYLNSNHCEGWLTAYNAMSSAASTSSNTITSIKGQQTSNNEVSFLVNFFNAVLMSPQVCTAITSIQNQGNIFLNSLGDFLNQVPLLIAMRSIELDSIHTTFERSSGLTAAVDLKVSILHDMQIKQLRNWEKFQSHKRGLQNIFQKFLLNSIYIPVFFDNMSGSGAGMSTSNVLPIFKIISLYSGTIIIILLLFINVTNYYYYRYTHGMSFINRATSYCDYCFKTIIDCKIYFEFIGIFKTIITSSKAIVGIFEIMWVRIIRRDYTIVT